MSALLTAAGRMNEAILRSAGEMTEYASVPGQTNLDNLNGFHVFAYAKRI